MMFPTVLLTELYDETMEDRMVSMMDDGRDSVEELTDGQSSMQTALKVEGAGSSFFLLR